ncbi:hypothetical protein T439DRAFT_324151 [Meredithblackwellia eburnea MCA 4105]
MHNHRLDPHSGTWARRVFNPTQPPHPALTAHLKMNLTSSVDIPWGTVASARSAFVAILSVWITLVSLASVKLVWYFHAKKYLQDCGRTEIQRVLPSGLGDILDSVTNSKVRQRIWKGPFVCLALVFALSSAVHIAAGYIARELVFSQDRLELTSISGTMVTDMHDSILSASAEGIVMMESLRKANFPLGELLDFVPDAGKSWAYSPTTWNSTWKGDCSIRGPHTVSTVYKQSGYSAIMTFEERFLRLHDFGIDSLDNYTTGRSGNSFYIHSDSVEMGGSYTGKEEIAVIRPDLPAQSQTLNPTYNSAPFHVRYIYVLMQNFERVTTNTNLTLTVNATFTLADCTYVNRLGPVQTPDDNGEYRRFAAYPWTPDLSTWADGLLEPFRRNSTRAFANGYSPPPITGEDLIQYSQAYLALKDSQYLRPVTRSLLGHIGTVQLNLAGLIIVTITSFVAIVSLLWCWSVGIVWKEFKKIPLSKIDWADLYFALQESVVYYNIPKYEYMPSE